MSFNENSIFLIKNNGEPLYIKAEEKDFPELSYEYLTLKGPSKIQGVMSKKYIIKVSCGTSHTLFLTHSGMVFATGSNDRGQLGAGDNFLGGTEPVMVQSLIDYKITDIFTGSNHNIVFGYMRDIGKTQNKGENKQENSIFAWGDNSYGQLGIGKKTRKSSLPTKIDYFTALIRESNSIVCITGCLNSSFVLFENGNLYGFGDNLSNQISQEEENSYNLPFLMNFDFLLEDKKNKTIVIDMLSSANSVVLVTNKDTLICFGKIFPHEIRVIKLKSFDNDVKLSLIDEKLELFYWGKAGDRELVESSTEIFTKTKEEKKEKNLPIVEEDTSQHTRIIQPEDVKKKIEEKIKIEPENKASVDLQFFGQFSPPSNAAIKFPKKKMNDEDTKEKRESSQQLKCIKNNSNIQSLSQREIKKSPILSERKEEGASFSQEKKNKFSLNYIEPPNKNLTISEIFSFLPNKLSEYNNKIIQNFKKRKQQREESEIRELVQTWAWRKKDDSIKEYFYQGLPSNYRGKMWLLCIKNSFSITKEYFEIELRKAKKEANNLIASRKIDQFEIPFEYLGIFKESSPLYDDLQEIILTCLSTRPDIIYYPSLSYLAGMVLINMEKFQSYVSLMNIILNPNLLCYYLEDKQKINNRNIVFKQLFLLNIPELCSFFELNNILPEYYFSQWCMSIFSKNVNIELAVRIWDIYLIEGLKTLFSASISILFYLQKDLLEMETQDILDLLLNLNKKKINENQIIENIKRVKYLPWIEEELKKMGNTLNI